MKFMIKAWFIFAAVFFAQSPFARAEFHFYCGEGREKGLQQSEIAFVDSLESPMKLYLKGREVPGEKLGIRSTDDGRWIVSIDRGPGKALRQFEFNQKNASVQEYSVEDRGSEKPLGSKRKCEFRQEEFKDDAS